MNAEIESGSSSRLGTVLVILALFASAMTVLFLLNMDDSSALIVDDDGDCGDNAFWVYYRNGLLVVSGRGDMYDYSETNAPWYAYCNDITEIAIDNNITSLGAGAFRDCVNVKVLTIPITLDSVKSNEHPVFAGCTNIGKINLTYGTNGYGCDYSSNPVNNNWFQNTPWYQSRYHLKDLHFEEGIKGIGSDSFRDLCCLDALVIPNSVVALGNYAFFSCNNVTDLTIPVSLRPFCDERYPAFFACVSIQKVTFTRGNGVPYDYTDIDGSYTLVPWNINKRLPKTIVIADDVDDLGEMMFNNCCLKEITLPVSIDFTGYDGCDRPFFGLYRNYIEKVTLTKGNGVACDSTAGLNSAPWDSVYQVYRFIVDEGVTDLGDFLVEECIIGSLVLPNSLVSLGKNTFLNCLINELTIPISLNAVWLDEYPAFQGTYDLYRIKFTPGSGYGFNYSAYEDKNCWYQHTPWFLAKHLRSIEFEDGIVRIGTDSFRELKICSVVLPDSVRILGNHAFYNCKELIRLTAPITLDLVGNERWPAFEGCKSMNVRLTPGETGLGWNYNESHLPFWSNPDHLGSTFIFDEGISHIGIHAFDGFTFIGYDGSVLEPTAKNLSGHTFSGSGSVKTQLDGLKILMQYAS